MSRFNGETIRLTVFGESHSPEIGMTLEGIPAGEKLDAEKLEAFLSRRAPGRNEWSTPRKEADEPVFRSGLTDGVFSGDPVTAVIRNSDVRPGDYESIRNVPRPGHADYAAFVKYGAGFTGGGAFSGRMTAPLCAAGGICLQLLEKEGIEIVSRIASVGGVSDEGELTGSTAFKEFPVVSDERGEEMIALIKKVKAEGDSVGGIVECAVTGVPAGLGGPMFDGMESRLSALAFGIPAVKGIEFGAGFGCARLKGSENNDRFVLNGGKVKTETNNCGGILGGITNGMPLTFRVAFKPTPSISKKQKSVDLSSLEEVEISVPGRHDPCVVPRAVPVVEAVAAIAVYDALISERNKVKE